MRGRPYFEQPREVTCDEHERCCGSSFSGLAIQFWINKSKAKRQLTIWIWGRLRLRINCNVPIANLAWNLVLCSCMTTGGCSIYLLFLNIWKLEHCSRTIWNGMHTVFWPMFYRKYIHDNHALIYSLVIRIINRIMIAVRLFVYLRACSYGQKLSRLARKLFDKFTSEISPCYENNMKSYIAFIWDEKFSRVPRSRLLTGESRWPG